MKVDIFDKQNNKMGEADLPERIFGVKWNSDLVHQVLTAQMANSRIPWAHTKDRGEVSGGGKKPWKQKGTGRARHGSIRSPLWVGGGVAFGPTKERNYAKKINAKMKRLAIFSVLSKKIKDNELKIVDSLKIENGKTKKSAEILKRIIDKAGILVILSSANKSANKTFSNIKNVGVLSPQSLNVYDLLKKKNIVLEKEAVSEIENHYK